MTSERKQEVVEEQGQPATGSVEKRRSLLKAGLAATPVLMTLSSRSAYGCQTTRPSGFCSMKNATKAGIHTSSHSAQPSPCKGQAPTTWCNQVQTAPKYQHGWPSACYPKTYKGYTTATTCDGLFGGSAGYLAGQTCYDVMHGNVSSADDFHKWCIAARLNARAGLTSGVCEETDVQAMWSEVMTKGYYEPIAGQKWSKSDCIAYLTSTCSS